MHPAYFVLILPPLFWAGNFVVGRDVVQSFDPVAFSFYRWFLAWLLIIPFTGLSVIRAWQDIKPNLPVLALLAATSVAAFNTLAYIGLQDTTATNGTLLNSLIPILILVLMRVFWKQPVGAMQWLGVLISFVGVLVILTRMDSTVLLAFSFNPGDLWVLVAVVIWSIYSILLRYRPKNLSAPVFLTLTITLGMLFLLPLQLFVSNDAPIWTSRTVFSIFYVAAFPSLLAYLCWNYGIRHLGADVAGQYTHLMPFFGAALAVLFLNEQLQLYHLVGGGSIALGIIFTVKHKIVSKG